MLETFKKPSHVVKKMEVSVDGQYLSKFGKAFVEEYNSSSSHHQPIHLHVKYAVENTVQLIPGMQLSLKFLGHYICSSCHKNTKKIYSGFCYICLTTKAQADLCMMSPNRCHYLAGTCREPNWGDDFCYQAHYVYLSFTDKFKVGLTREQQIPIRWIDQGATAATLLCRVTSRHQAGVIEHALMSVVSDKSHWLKMLEKLNQGPSLEEMIAKKNELLSYLKEQILTNQQNLVKTPAHLNIAKHVEIFENSPIYFIQYPLSDSVKKIKSVSLEKLNLIEGQITGIKGQYILMDHEPTGNTFGFNMRRHEGFVTEFNIS